MTPEHKTQLEALITQAEDRGVAVLCLLMLKPSDVDHNTTTEDFDIKFWEKNVIQATLGHTLTKSVENFAHELRTPWGNDLSMMRRDLGKTLLELGFIDLAMVAGQMIRYLHHES
jgi:hypothetical protein